MRFCPEAASGITSATPTSTDPFASRRSVTPISRGHANALGFQHPGAFCFWRSQKEIQRSKRDCIALPKHPGLLARGRETREGARMRRAWMLRHGRQADAIAQGLALSTRRQCGTSMNDTQRYRLAACPVRAALPWRMPGIGRRCSASGRKLRGRAAAQAVGHRFESGSSTTG